MGLYDQSWLAYIQDKAQYCLWLGTSWHKQTGNGAARSEASCCRSRPMEDTGDSASGGAFSLAPSKPLCIMIITTLQLQLQGLSQQHTGVMAKSASTLGSLMLLQESARTAHSLSPPQAWPLCYNKVDVGGTRHPGLGNNQSCVQCSPIQQSALVEVQRRDLRLMVTYSLTIVNGGPCLVIMSVERCITVFTYCNKGKHNVLLKAGFI